MESDPALFSGLFSGQPELIRSFLETALKLRELRQLYCQARSVVGPQKALSQSILETLDIRLQISDRDRERIPVSGKLLVVANHPFGIVDGMLLDSLLLSVRPDFKILTNSMIATLEELRDRTLPVDLFGEERHNLRSMRRVLQHLRTGGGVGFFPAGEVSHFQPASGRVEDGEWSTAAVRCAWATNTPVLPMYFCGSNSLSFQLAGLVHPRLRTARLVGELFNKEGRTVEVRVGTPVDAAELNQFASAEEATRYLRARTYCLAHRQEGKRPAKLRPVLRQPRPVAVAADATRVAEELERLPATVETADYRVVLTKAQQSPATLQELGRLREETFRAVGEGSGLERDLDRFDSVYQQLVLWDKRTKRIAGGYRLTWTSDLPPQADTHLYTSTLFRFAPEFFRRLGPAVELGRSFVRLEYQRDYAPLLLMWQALARTVASRPESPVLFGPVSISSDYSQAARELIVRFVTEHKFDHGLASLLQPRRPFRSRVTSTSDLEIISSCFRDVEALDGVLEDVGGHAGMPVLLRQYLRLGGKVAGFNVDRKFADALDGLLIVDLRDTPPKLLSRYMGAELAATFLASVPAKPADYSAA